VSELISQSFELPKTNGAEPRAQTFRAPKRIQTNFLAQRERQVLNAFCRVLPEWVTPDRLTVLGVIGSLVTAIGYAAVNWHSAFYLLASFGLVVNWFGDSLDGSLARHRKIERPRYGYFVDHSTDVVSNFLIIGGLGFSPHIGMAPALFALAGYLALSIYVFLLNQVTGQFQLTFANCGPTEIRLGIIAFNLALFLIGPTYLSLMGHRIALAPTGVALLGGGLAIIFVVNLYKTARDLARQSENEQKAAESDTRRSLERLATSQRAPFESKPDSSFAV
jgi:archaetidylinositol phosphate synthase